MRNEKAKQERKRKYMKKSIYCQLKDLEILTARVLSLKTENNLKPPTITQARIMEYILEHNNKDIYQKDLESALNLRRATVSEVLKTMEKRNLIIRVKNPHDARSKKIVLSEFAEKQHDKIKNNFQIIENKLIKNISKEELKAFSLTLQKMQDNLKK